MSWRWWLAPVVLGALCLAAFGRGLPRWFVSEDFLILGQLARHPFLDTLWRHLTGPLLGFEPIAFYRPVAAALLHLELEAWGTWPAGYLAVHLAVHAVNATLVFRLVERLTGGRSAAPWMVAIVFAVYPLHPNVVLFVASFAPLFATTFLLAALLGWERYRATGGAGVLVASLAWFALALGSYEQVIILPVLGVAHGLLRAGSREREQRRRFAVAAVSTTAVVGLYLVVRTLALGRTIGGYGDIPGVWSVAWLPGLVRQFLDNCVRLVHPVFNQPVAPAAAVAAGVVLVVGSTASLVAWSRARRTTSVGPAPYRAAGLWLLGVVWICASQAPFSFVGVVPGNARYWYLTSIGLGLTAASVLTLVRHVLPAVARPRLAAALQATLVATVASSSVVIANQTVDSYLEASRLARSIQRQLLEWRGRGVECAFVTGSPHFVESPRGVNVAQIFHWGLGESVAPPFARPGMTVYPLPPLSDRELTPVVERGDLGTVLRWDRTAERLVAVDPVAGPAPRRIASRVEDGTIVFRPAAGLHHRLVVVARVNWSVEAVDTAATATGDVRAGAPPVVLRTMRRLHASPIHGWVEARDAAGRLVAVSRLHPLG